MDKENKSIVAMLIVLIVLAIITIALLVLRINITSANQTTDGCAYEPANQITLDEWAIEQGGSYVQSGTPCGVDWTSDDGSEHRTYLQAEDGTVLNQIIK